MTGKSIPSRNQQYRAAYTSRMKQGLRTETPKKLKISIVVLVVCAFVGLVFPVNAILSVFFGLTQTMRLAHASLYPFRFSKRLLYVLRFGTVLCFVLGVIGVVINWSDIYPYIKPIIDWINE
jgi:hypothetical protein